MPERDALYLGHMLDMSQKAAEKVRGVTREQCEADENLSLALTYLVQTIGEAASRVSAETRTERAEIPWRQITGMRNRIVHDYMNIDFDIVWSVVTQDLPGLILLLEPAVAATDQENTSPDAPA
jgi:uncharacterized protein with HEPN domain